MPGMRYICQHRVGYVYTTTIYVSHASIYVTVWSTITRMPGVRYICQRSSTKHESHHSKGGQQCSMRCRHIRQHCSTRGDSQIVVWGHIYSGTLTCPRELTKTLPGLRSRCILWRSLCRKFNPCITWYIHTYTYIHKYMYIYTYIHIYIYIILHTYVCMYVCMYVYIYIIYIHIYMEIQALHHLIYIYIYIINIYIYLYIYIHKYLYIYIYTPIHTHTHTHTHTPIHIYAYIHIYIYIYVIDI